VGGLEARIAEVDGADALEEELAGKHSSLVREHAKRKAEEEQLASRLAGVDFRYTDPEKKFDRRRVKGTVASNLTLKETKHATALEALAGGKLHQVIVDRVETGTLLLSKGQLARRVTIIPLDKIRAQAPPADKVAAARKLVGDRVWPAVELVEFSQELAPAMSHVFGSSMVCADKEAARAVCEQIKLKTVTLEGDLYDPQGTLTGGSRNSGNGSLLCKIAELSRLRAGLAQSDATLGQATAELEAARSKAEQLQALRSEHEIKAHELSLHETALKASEAHKLAVELESLQKQLAETQEAADRAQTELKAAQQQRDSLAEQLQDFEGNREERLKKSKAAIGAAEKEARALAKSLQAASQAETTASLRLDELRKSVAADEESLSSMQARRPGLESKVRASAAEELARKEAYDAAAGDLRAAKEKLNGFSAEIARLKEQGSELEARKSEAQLELKQTQHTHARCLKEAASAQAAERELLKKHQWMVAEREQFGVAGGTYDFKKRKPQHAQAELSKATAQLEGLAKRINKKVLAMFEKAEQEYNDLMERKATVEKDKAKIEAVIDELAQKKIDALRKTWEKVNGDFGAIFSTLLPGTNAKLDKQEGCPVEEGLVIKVAFGSMWKPSLVDLSGGQRSLVALSLVLSLLRFKPAPVYILDEIDAALDLSHTQNIGQMIRTHFQQSQFIVVSLKEGMFNNANVLFRTKFVDGVSTISRTVPPGAANRDKDAAAKAKAKGSAAATNRRALTSVN